MSLTVILGAVVGLSMLGFIVWLGRKIDKGARAGVESDWYQHDLEERREWEKIHGRIETINRQVDQETHDKLNEAAGDDGSDPRSVDIFNRVRAPHLRNNSNSPGRTN